MPAMLWCSSDLCRLCTQVTIPGRKAVYRLYGVGDRPICDLLMGADEAAPSAGVSILCRHPFEVSEHCSGCLVSEQRLFLPFTMLCVCVCVWTAAMFTAL